MLKHAKEKKRKKMLAHLTTIADSFLKARSVYPRDHEAFLKLAGQKEVDVFYQTMLLVEAGAQKHGYVFDWFYDQDANEWIYVFTDDPDFKEGELK